MATTYQISAGHDNTAGLTDITPQPACPDGIVYPEWVELPNGGSEPNGWAMAQLVFNDALQASEFDAQLTAMGLSTAYWAEVTVTLPKDDRSFGNYNAVISKPRSPRYKNWYSGVVYQLKQVEAI